VWIDLTEVTNQLHKMLGSRIHKAEEHMTAVSVNSLTPILNAFTNILLLELETITLTVI